MVETDLFDELLEPKRWSLADGTMLLCGFALQGEAVLLNDLKSVIAQSPLRHMVTSSGFAMSVAMTNCGKLGWVTDRKGYRYDALDPNTGAPWPVMPASFLALAAQAALEAGFADFVPDACLINQYKPGARMGLHQDKDERDFSQPIVSVSLGVPATFLLGGFERADKTVKIQLNHGDVIVWGGASRLRYHGVLPLKAGHHPAFGLCRINLTFRKAG
ncbi:MAG TPA: DNA oxidative demethylase AlkB [Methylotenera sp.]|nr:DNA oxidative demethylase AlkB [Methylotenera sp.]HPV45366.1 DNA oxidative demethylase AlkB [Methylotenera sp.]